MLGSHKQMQSGFVDFHNSPMVLGLLVGKLSLRPGSFKNLTRWDFARAVTQEGSYLSEVI